MSISKMLLRPTWIEIDLDIIKNNMAEIKRVIGEKLKIIAVLKGNAYGCGLIEVAEVLSKENIYGFGLGNIYEAIEVRKISNLPILLFGNTLTNAIPEIIRHNLTPSISDLEWLRAYSEIAGNSTVPIFVKVDVGLNRLGVPYNEAISFFTEISNFQNIKVEGIQTHITGEKDYIKQAFDKFLNLIKSLEDRGFEIPIKLAAQSQLIAQFPYTYLNAVDPGKMIYGIIPYKVEINIQLRPAFVRLMSRIIHIKKGVNISSNNYKRIGVVPLGTADGLPSVYSQKGEVIVNGNRTSIIKVDAEHTRVNISEIPRSDIGDEVVFIGRQGNETIDFYEVADKCNTTETELLRSLSHCIPRIYFRNGSPCRVTPVF